MNTHKANWLTRRAFAAGVAILMTAPAFGQSTSSELDEALRAGGLVVLVRHGATTWSGIDNIEWPRERQRLLSEEGERQSRNLGEAFRRNDWKAGDVLASPFARTSEMAQIAFGRVTNDPMLLGVLSDGEGADERKDYIRNLVNRAVPEGENRVIVSHSSNISAATGENVPEGGAVILRPNGDSHQVLATLVPEDWTRFASR